MQDRRNMVFPGLHCAGVFDRVGASAPMFRAIITLRGDHARRWSDICTGEVGVGVEDMVGGLSL